MNSVVVEYWIDLNSKEAKELDIYHFLKKSVDLGLKSGFIKHDNIGRLFMNDGSENPIHAEIDGCLVGIKTVTRAAN